METIYLKDILKWIKNTRNMNNLKEIRIACLRRIKRSYNTQDYNPLKSISVEKKREVLKDLFV